MRTPLAIIAVLIAVLLGVDALAGGSGAGAPETTPVATIAKRVEAVRGLRFDTVPRAQAVTPAEARREVLTDFDVEYPPAQREADEEVLMLLGLAPPGLSLREISATLFEQGVAGYYSPRTGRLRTVTGSATSTRVLTETVLAHELTHALEDQRFELLDATEQGTDDAQLARLALVEGTATVAMTRYTQEHFSTEELVAGTFASVFADIGDMPAFLQTQAMFAYGAGEEFVSDLLRRAGGRWDLVDTAERLRPPSSTEQVMHPERYLRADEPRRVRFAAGRALGPGWTRARAGTWGELQTRELLADSGGGGSAEAAAGWGGDRWELWRSPDAEGCATPCRAADVLVMRWRWDSARDAREFLERLRGWVVDGRGGTPSGPGAWTLEAGGSAAVTAVPGPRGGAVTLALAPDARLARRAAAAPAR